MTATPTLTDTRRVLTDLLADADADVERESEYRGSSYDHAVQRATDLRVALAGLASAEQD